MADYQITAPDGTAYQVTAPDGTSQADVLNMVQQQHAPQASVPTPADMKSVDVPTAPEGALDKVANVLTMGAAQPMRAAMYAGTRALLGPGKDLATGEDEPTQTFGENYQQKLDQLRAAASLYPSEHPIANALATGGGSLLLPASGVGTAAEGASLGKATLQSMGLGGVAGGISGAANSQGNPLRDAALGAGLGAAIGAPIPLAGQMVSPLTANLASRIGGQGYAEAQAINQLKARAVEGNQVGLPSVPDLQQTFADAATAGKPLALADQPQFQGLAGSVARAPGESNLIANDFLGNRMSGMGPRIVGDINDVSPNSAFATGQQLAQQRSTNAAPLYQQAYAAPPLNPDLIAPGGALDDLMNRPSMVSAANRALGLAKEEGRDPLSLGITFNQAGDPQFEGVPSWQTLDYLKRGLDDVLNSHRDSTTGRLVRDEGVNAIDSTRRQFVGLMDDNNPDYAAARQAWGGPSEALAALKQGQDFRTYSPEELTNMFSAPPRQGGLTPNQQDFFRVGAFNALRQGATKTGTATGIIGSNAVNQRGATGMVDQLTPLFNNPDDAAAFVNKMQTEHQILGSTNQIAGNSLTASRLAQDAAPGAEGNPGLAALGHLSIGGGALLHGDPLLMATQVPSFFRNLGRVGANQANRPEVQAATARLLFNSDPQQVSQTLSQLMSSPPARVGSAITIPLATSMGNHPLPSLASLAQLIARMRASAEQPAEATGTNQ